MLQASLFFVRAKRWVDLSKKSMQHNNISRRQVQQEFIARGLVAREEARSTGAYASKGEVMDSLRSMLDAGSKC